MHVCQKKKMHALVKRRLKGNNAIVQPHFNYGDYELAGDGDVIYNSLSTTQHYWYRINAKIHDQYIEYVQQYFTY